MQSALEESEGLLSQLIDLSRSGQVEFLLTT
jgi:hypothetical protein